MSYWVLVRLSLLGTRVATPNDPKLSDGEGWRAGCVVGERRRQEAASVTAGAVRCSAWLGDVVAIMDDAKYRWSAGSERQKNE